MILKNGSKGEKVKELQEFLQINVDGIFGEGTTNHVINWQLKNGLIGDGIVGNKTWEAMGLATTDNSEKIIVTDNNLFIEYYMLPKDEYKTGPTEKEYLFLHHTARWHNPYKCVDGWNNDTRGAIATEFVLGGPSVKGNNTDYDGKLLKCMPDGAYGWHLGKNGSQHMHSHSVGIEVCNFGYIIDGKTYAGTSVDESQIVTLSEEFRGHKTWHRYSNEQIEVLSKFIKFIGERDGIDIREGLPNLIREKGVKAFDFNEDAYYGRIKGILTHTNTRKDKFDMFPQSELLDMLLSL